MPGNEYTPDNWVIIKIKGEDPHYRVLGGWSGGYTTGDSWRMNSGITSLREDDARYFFHGSTGSCYSCGKKSYGLKMNNAYVWDQLQQIHGDKVEMMPEDTDWMNIDWGDKT